MHPRPFLIYLVITTSICLLIGKRSVCALPGEKGDTVSAVVMYGDAYLLDGIEYLDVQGIQALKDSLLRLPQPRTDVVEQIRLYERIPNMEFGEVFELIDSLFDCEHIPYPLINQINLYVSKASDHQEEDIDTSAYPADFYYQSWDTDIPNPYASNQLAKNDSTLFLRLTGGKRLQEYEVPIEGVVTSRFGWRDGRNHNGVDIDLEVWDTVRTCFPGMVRMARYYGGYGRVVVVRHWNGLETLYAHLHRIKVKPGDVVSAGDLIGLGGSSGHSTGSHLHWEIRFKGVPLDPHAFIDFEKGELQNDTLVLKKTRYGYAAYPAGTQFYQVKRGDFLYKIANRYGTSVSNLCKLNGIRRNSILRVGQRIRVI